MTGQGVRREPAAGSSVMSEGGRLRAPLVARLATLALVVGLWFWPAPEGLTTPGVASVRALRRGDRRGRRRRASDPHGVDPGARRRGAHRHADSGAGLLGIRQRNDPAHRRRVPGGARRGEVRARRAHRPCRRERSSADRRSASSYSLFLVDGVIAPAFPSNTARSGVLYPLAFSLAEAAGARPGEPARRRLGGFLMFSGIASLTPFVGALAHGDGRQPARRRDRRGRSASRSPSDRGWSRRRCRRWRPWSLLPLLLLYKLIAPEVTATPDAPAAAGGAGGARAADAVGVDRRRHLRWQWSCCGRWRRRSGSTRRPSRFSAWASCSPPGVLTLDDIAKEGDVLATFIWFAVLFTMSSQLNELGFMGFLGERLAGCLGGLSALAAGVLLLVAYVLLHYLFVSQTAHLLALFGVFLDVGVKLGVPRRAAGVPAALRHQLLLGDHAAGVEREPAVRRQRLSSRRRALPARRHQHRRSTWWSTSSWDCRGCASSPGEGEGRDDAAARTRGHSVRHRR